ncbi:MAG: hypothetical protein ACXU86_08255 [Archangium sp.]
MAYSQKPSLEIRLTHHGLWSAQMIYDRVLATLGDHEPHTPVVFMSDVQLNSLPEDVTLDPEHYQVSFTLGIPFVNPAQDDIMRLGDSLLQHGRSLAYVTLGSGADSLRIALVPNEFDRLSKIVAFIPASYTPQTAEDIAYRAVRPLLGQLSAVYRIPLDAVLVERFLFRRPDIVSYWRMILYPYVPKQVRSMDVVRFQPLLEYDSFIRAMNHYREGANSWSPVHRFLSWFKASEAVMALRNDLREAKRVVRFDRTFLADSPPAQMLFPDCVGRPHTDVLGANLRDP